MVCPLGSTCFGNDNSTVSSHQSRIFISEMNCKESFRTSGQEQRGDRKAVVFSSMQRGGWNEKTQQTVSQNSVMDQIWCLDPGINVKKSYFLKWIRYTLMSPGDIFKVLKALFPLNVLDSMCTFHFKIYTIRGTLIVYVIDWDLQKSSLSASLSKVPQIMWLDMEICCSSSKGSDLQLSHIQ